MSSERYGISLVIEPVSVTLIRDESTIAIGLLADSMEISMIVTRFFRTIVNDNSFATR